jgi:hypothetical protein
MTIGTFLYVYLSERRENAALEEGAAGRKGEPAACKSQWNPRSPQIEGLRGSKPWRKGNGSPGCPRHSRGPHSACGRGLRAPGSECNRRELPDEREPNLDLRRRPHRGDRGTSRRNRLLIETNGVRLRKCIRQSTIATGRKRGTASRCLCDDKPKLARGQHATRCRAEALPPS